MRQHRPFSYIPRWFLALYATLLIVAVASLVAFIVADVQLIAVLVP